MFHLLSATDSSESESVCFFRLFFVCRYSPGGLVMNKLSWLSTIPYLHPYTLLGCTLKLVLIVKDDLHQT